jgi:hypothetical protein
MQTIKLCIHRCVAAMALTLFVPLVSAQSTPGFRLIPNTGISAGLFGHSVASDDRYQVVGVPQRSNGNNAQQGAVYTFERSGTTWTQRQIILAPDGAQAHFFGTSVTMLGTDLYVGASGRGMTNTSLKRAIYHYVRDASGDYQFQALLQPVDNPVDSYFGDATGVGADWLISNGKSSAGAHRLNLFERSPAGWAERTAINVDSDTEITHIDVERDLVVLGAKAALNASAVATGAAYVYRKVGGGLQLVQKLTASDGSANDKFGFSVAISGEYILIGAHDRMENGGASTGAAYLFQRSATGYTQVAEILSPDPAANDFFGKDLEACGNRYYIGAPGDAQGSANASGAVYRFDLAGASMSFVEKFQLSPSRPFSYYGDHMSLSSSGLIVGAPLEGAAYYLQNTCLPEFANGFE